MIEEMLRKFPEMIKSLLEKASQVNNETPKRKEAKDKLIKQLQSATEELGKLSQQPGERLTEEQIKKLLEIPRPLPQLPAVLQSYKGEK
jgi:hypothetical protein